MAEGNRPVTRIPSIFDSDDSDDGPSTPASFQPLTTNTSQREKHEKLPLPADNLSSNSEDSDEPSLSLRLSNKSPPGDDDLTGGLPEEASTSEDTGSLETEDVDVKEMDNTNLEVEDVPEPDDIDDDDPDDDDGDDVNHDKNIAESQNFGHSGVGNVDDLSNDDQNVSDDSEDADQPGDSSSSLVEDDMESQNEGEGVVDFPHSEARQLDVKMDISEEFEAPMETDDKREGEGGPELKSAEKCSQESDSAQKDEKVMVVIEKSQDNRKDEMEGCRENEDETEKLPKIKSNERQDEVDQTELAQVGDSVDPPEAEECHSETKNVEQSTHTSASSPCNIVVEGDIVEMEEEEKEVLDATDNSVVKKNQEKPVDIKPDQTDERVSGVATPESESSVNTVNDGMKKTDDEDECRKDRKKESTKDIYTSDDENSTEIGLKMKSEDDVEMQSGNVDKGGVGDEVDLDNSGEAKDTSSPTRSNSSKELASAVKKVEISKLSSLQVGKRVPVRVQDVYTDSEEESNKSTGGASVGVERIKMELLGGSETDSVDPEDQRDSTSLVDSSRASSIEPGGVSSSQPSLASNSPARSTPQFPKHWTPPHDKKKRGFIHVDREACQKAFDAGWRREIVYRAVVDPNKASTRSDIYYYTPTGKKLRSKVEIELYLKKNQIDLTKENFTWAKEPLGIDEKYEMIRHASVSKVQGNLQSRGKSNGSPNIETPPPTVKASPVTKQVTKLHQTGTTPSLKRRPELQSGPSGDQVKRSRMKVTPVVPAHLRKKNAGSMTIDLAPTHLKKETADIGTVSQAPVYHQMENAGVVTVNRSKLSPSSIEFTTKKVINRMQMMGVLKSSTSTKLPSEQGELSPTLINLAKSINTTSGNLRWVEPIARPGPASKKRVVFTTRINVSLSSSRILTPLLFKANPDPMQTFHCTGTCVLASGTVPTLQCIKCLCLFHPECTDTPFNAAFLIQTGGALFLCPNCYRANKENSKAQIRKPPKSYEPLAHDPVSEESDGEEFLRIKGDTSINEYIQVSFKPPMPLTPPISPSSQSGHRVTGGQSTQGTSKFSEVVITKSSTTSKQGSGSTVMNSKGRSTKGGLQLTHSNLSENQIIQIQSSEPEEPQVQMLHHVGSGEEMVKIPFANGQHRNLPRGRIFPSSWIGSQLPLLMPKTNIQQQQIQPVTSSPILLPIPTTTPTSIMAQQEMTGGMMLSVNVQSQQDINVSRDRDFIYELCKNYRILAHIFRYLSVTDRLNAAQVCLLWRDLAFHPSLWEVTRIRNIGVRSWSNFANFLERRNAKVLDLRNMRLPGTCRRIEMEQRLSSKSSTIPQTLGKDKAEITLNNLVQISYSSSEKNRFIMKACSKGVIDVEQERELGERLKDQRNPSGTVTTTPSQEVGKSCSPKSVKMGTSIGTTTSNLEVIKIDCENTTNAKEKESAGKGPQNVKRRKSNANDDKSDLIMKCEESSKGSNPKQKEDPESEGMSEATWEEASSALGKVRCLTSVMLPPCPGHALQVFLSKCHQLASVTAADLTSAAGTEAYIPTQSVFDPAYLMENPDLEALHLGSVKGFSFTTNFNFIKLRHLRTLVIRGLVGASWPYMGNDLTSLHVAPVKMFSPYTWANIGSMTKLEVLWLENGGSLNDLNICDALSHLSNLQRLCLFNFTIGPKMGNALKKLPLLKKLVAFPTPAKEDDASLSEENGHMMTMVGMLRQLEELVWMVRPKALCTRKGISYIRISPKNVKTFSGLFSTSISEDNLWKLEDLQNILSLSLPQVRVRIVKMDSSCSSLLSALETIY
ncbi:hypothetical protein Pcinc_010943 [Petrolisthes cinctipes]|uniref:MBD domain-containing protein n=1 Tax=Petrolisthes cinctipes TaxID=88211 RepID=A0AAE1G288_PETCI|nr:hypothetical protein Pcinc_010943 [Petrolisthes cinctipes]